MTWPAALSTVTVHGSVQGADGLVARGSVEFMCPVPLRVNGDDVIVGPFSVVGVLDVAGEFDVVLPVNDDADVSPAGWAYRVAVRTDVWTEDFDILLPAAGADPRELRDIAPAVLVPDVVAFALSAHSHSGADITSGTVPFARLPVGITSTTVSAGNHTHEGGGGGGGGGTTVTWTTGRVTSGDVDPQNTSAAWQLLTGGPVMLSPPVDPGDVVDIVPSFMYRANSTGNFFDLAVVVDGLVVRCASSGTDTPATEGDPSIYRSPESYRGAGGGVWNFVVQADEINDDGVVDIRLITKGGGGSGSRVHASTSYPFRWRIGAYKTAA